VKTWGKFERSTGGYCANKTTIDEAPDGRNREKKLLKKGAVGGEGGLCVCRKKQNGQHTAGNIAPYVNSLEQTKQGNQIRDQVV